MCWTFIIKVQKGGVPIHLWGFMDPPSGVGSKCRQEFRQNVLEIQDCILCLCVCLCNK